LCASSGELIEQVDDIVKRPLAPLREERGAVA
jgi:hypothetical protein